MGWEVEKAWESVQSSTTVKTRSPEQSIVGHETQWTQLWSRVRSQVDVIHFVRSTGAIMSNSRLHSVKSCPEKSRPIKYGDQIHGVMIAIEYSYKQDRKNYFNLWCELGWLLLRQSHFEKRSKDSLPDPNGLLSSRVPSDESVGQPKGIRGIAE